ADWILLVLPLHHVHGIINLLTCALWAGARCEMLPKFDAERVWGRIADGDLTLFMAVPTIYGKLITAWEAAAPERRRAWSAGCAPPRMRLMVSGSAALPVQQLERWRGISGHVLLERYGMTEIGMALANPLHGTRRPGFVGTPLADPCVQARLARSRCVGRRYFSNTGGSRRRRPRRSETAGSAPATSPSSKMARTGCSAA